MRILAIGAHPDDWEVGAAGLLQRAAERFVLIASWGERGGEGTVRKDEALAAIRLIGAEWTIYQHLDTEIRAAQLAPEIERAIRDFLPDTIVTTSPRDAHQDHAAVSAATMIAVRDWCGTVLAYCTPSAAERFTPNWFVGLSAEEMATKIRAAACHVSQAHRPYLAPAYLEAAGRYWAQVVRSTSPFVEAYELLRHREGR